ncbi:MAG: single-stranded-DNA-specific exonuclease RecJ, partial [Rhodospirillales bacterium]|nr:single-stranded-DNA-specific exonuclease RecJ [Acetobacter sp.]
MAVLFFVPEYDASSVDTLAAAHQLPRALAQVLWCRGVRTEAEVRAFLSPETALLHDPFSMRGMAEAVDRLRAALLGSERILIYGDYDVDGTVATVLLQTALVRAAVSLGVNAEIRYHIPHRIREGYGMRETRIADAAG